MTYPIFTPPKQVWPAPGIGGLVVRKNSGADVGTRPRINLIEGTGMSITVADDSTDNELDITLQAAVSGVLALDDLTDVDTTTYPPTTDAVLLYDGSTWRPAAIVTDGSDVVVDPITGNIIYS